MKQTLFDTEGAHNLPATIRAVVRCATSLKIYKILVFTAHGNGALELHKKVDDNTSVIAVTFPWEMTAKPEDDVVYIGMPSSERRAELTANGIRIVQGVMPFRSIGAEQFDAFSAITATLDAFGGSTKLCVQAVLMACDSAVLDAGERCIAMTTDTAIVARAGHAFNFLRSTSTFSVEQFICKPRYYQVTRGERELRIAERFHGITIDAQEGGDQKALP